MRRWPQRGFCLASRRTSFTDLLREGWASGGIWVGPLVLDQAPVPGEQCAGRHDAVQPEVSGQQPRERGDHGPIRPVQLRTSALTAQHSDLVPQYQDLHLFGGVAAGEQRQPAEQPGH